MSLDLATMAEQERALYEQRHAPATLVTIDGVTREQAFENYMAALAHWSSTSATASCSSS